MRPVLLGGLLVLSAGQARAQEEEEDHARRRWEWFYQQRAYPFGTIPAGALERARVQLEGLRRPLFGAVPPPISGTRWQAIGPRAIPTSGTSIGRISTVAIHPTNTNLLYVGGAQGGVWRSTDGGSNWTALTDKECSLAMGAIVLDPVNPAIVYAATGEQHFSADSYYGCGVLRSVDGGNTWTRLGASVFVRSRISRLVILPSTAGTVATTTILAASDNGLFRSLDGGANWVLVRAGTATDLVMDPSNERTLYVAIRTQGVFRSVDGGATWGALGAGFPTASLGRINITISASSPSRLYASLHNLSNSALLGILTTTDAGATWTQLPATGASCGTQCWYDMFIAVHPTNPNTIYFGGVGLFRSLDGGSTFSSIGNTIHVDQHYLAFDPVNAQRIYVTNDGGIYRSDNGGTTWTSLNAGLELTQFYGGISLHPSEQAIVLGGTQDNGTLRYSNNPTWAAVLGGDGGFTAINYDNPVIQFAETQWTAGSTSSGPRRSDGGGFVRKVNGIVTSEPALFIPPLVMDPVNAQVLYFGTNRVYRTADAAESWTPVSPVLVTTTGAVSAIAPAAGDPGT
ncbi:MAG: WD40/YVTN/BNR-like repeat-containing protein, partial [Longimicrobiales bacterium]